MTNMEKSTTEQSILSCIETLTDIVPEVLFRESSSNVMVVFQSTIPNEETTKKIESALKKFGNVLPNHSRENFFISFMIQR